MGRNVIVSEETVRELLEAHASLSAWYYELWSALRAANGTARSPDDAARAAFAERLGAEFPELASVARAIKVPRLYVPAPPTAHPGEPAAELETLIEPAAARLREKMAEAQPAEAPAPPAFVDPGAVRYEGPK
jgi:hypothetical protein